VNMLYSDKLSFSYKEGQIIFKDLDFYAGTGQCLIFTGRSGSGKTTLFRILQRKLNKFKGEISLEKEDIRKYSEKQYFTKFHFIDQDPNRNLIGLNPERDFRLWNEKKDIKEFRKLLDKYQLLSKRKELAWNLSYGEQKAIMFIYLELFHRDIWVLDEPIEGIDGRKKDHFLDLCLNHKTQGGTIIMFSHDTKSFEGLNPQIINLESYR